MEKLKFYTFAMRVSLITWFCILSVACFASTGPYHFDASGISRPVLENYLKRSVTMTEFLAVDPYTNDGPYLYKEDDVRLIKNIGAKFIGRSIYRWGREEVLIIPEYLEQAKKLAGEVHAYDPDVIFQASLFEIVTQNVEKIPIPSWAFEAMEMPAENRHFRYDLMLNPDGKFVNQIPDKPLKALLEVGYLDGLYLKSKGGKTPSGWNCQSLPYLVEFDNFGCSRTPGESTIESHFVWGYDEITWFYLQDEAYRQTWLRYAYNWVKENDPNGYLQMPVSRLISFCEGKGRGKYRANNKSADNPDGLNVEETIKELWNNQ